MVSSFHFYYELIIIEKEINMKEKIAADPEFIAYCGLYCGACPRFLKGKCSGCRKSETLSWCKIRNCNENNNYHTCAD
jgi:deoxyhypusine synthase